jgi:hypothetical protein
MNEPGLLEMRKTRWVAASFRADVSIVFAFAAALLVCPAVGRAISSPRAVAAGVCISAVTVLYGRSLTRLLPLQSAAVYFRIFELLVGFCAVSIVHLVSTAALGLSAVPAAALDVAIGLAILAFSAHRPSVPHTGGVTDPPAIWGDIVLLLLSAVLVSLWGRETVMAVPHAEATGLFQTWQDFPLHAAEITYLRDYPSFHGHSLYLADSAQPLYHRGSFTMSAVFSAFGGVPSLEAATTFWMPTGLLLCVLAVFVFGAALGGRAGGVAAVVVTFLTPDASTYGFHNKFLGFAWLIQMAGGSGYAIVPTLLALVVTVKAPPSRNGRVVATAAALVAAAAAFRVHVAILAAGTVFVMTSPRWYPLLTRRRIVVLLTGLVCVGAVVVWLESITLAPHFLTGRSHPLAFFISVHMQANNIPTPYLAWSEGHSDAVKFAIGYGMMLLAGCGILIPMLAAIWLTGRLRSLGPGVALIPLALVLTHVAVILLVPTPAHGDITDFGHRPFVLVYIVFAALVGTAAGRAISDWSVRTYGSERNGLLVLFAVGLAGCIVPWKMGARLQQSWVSIHSMIPISQDDFRAGRFVRAHSSSRDIVLAEDTDPLAVFVALTERAAFLSRVELFRSLGGTAAAIATERSASLAPLSSVSRFEELVSYGRRYGVGWYIANGSASRHWPVEVRSHCVYCGPSVDVFDLR